MSKLRMRITPQARVDLLEVWHFIAKDSIDAAGKVTDAIEAAIRNLAEMPGMGHQRADVTDIRYRFWSVYSYIIAYRVEGDELRVIRIVHGSRDFRRIFE